LTLLAGSYELTAADMDLLPTPKRRIRLGDKTSVVAMLLIVPMLWVYLVPRNFIITMQVVKLRDARDAATGKVEP